MKALLVNGSPHRNGCTARALKEVAKALNAEGVETQDFWIGNKNHSGCTACKSCAKTGVCALGGTVNELLEIAGEFDAFAFGTPVHWGAMAGNMASFMDRAFYADLLGGGNLFLHKPASAVISARRAGTTATWDQANKYFALAQMPIVSSRYWPIVHGSTPDEVEQDQEGLQTMRILGKNMAYLLKCKEAARVAGVEPPEPEAVTFTNFIR